MKLLLDEMMDPAVAAGLRARGHDVIAVGEVRTLQGLSDRALLSVAQADDRVVVTEDRGDFRRLGAADVRAGRPYPRLILTDDHAWPRGDRRTVGRLVRALDALLLADVTLEGELWLMPVD
ncbi:MAG: hypothetical protein F4Z08_06895 [Chloroflexi bacterium]|nr:hypothetical protein [Chloroflexota bacterium]MXZ46700.1 hypothetical protein [Chloroflexota bacterium]